MSHSLVRRGFTCSEMALNPSMAPPKEHFGEFLARLREERRLTQDRLALAAEVSTSTIVKQEASAECTFKRGTAIAVLSALHKAGPLAESEQRSFVRASGIEGMSRATELLVDALKRAGERPMALAYDELAGAVLDRFGEPAASRVLQALLGLPVGVGAAGGGGQGGGLVHHSAIVQVRGEDGKIYNVQTFSPVPSSAAAAGKPHKRARGAG